MDFVRASAVTIFNKNKVLLVKHKQASEHINDVYGLPAGRLELGEKEITAAIRELKEETGLTTQETNLTELNGTYENTEEGKTGTKSFKTTAYLCTKYSGKLISGEETEPVWVNLQNLENLNLIEVAGTIISDALKQKPR